MTPSRRSQIGVQVLAAFIVVYALVPVVWITSLSLKGGDDINNQKFWPTEVSWENYETVFDTALFTSALRNSLGIATIATVLAVVIATGAAYAATRLSYPGRDLALKIALVVTVFPAISIATPLFDLWRRIGLYDTWPGLIIPYISLTLPVAMWTLSSYFREIPRELEQAAQVDGATPWQAFRSVVAPLAAPGIFTTAIIAFLTAWNDFVYGITLTSTDRARPVPAALAFFSGESQFQQPTAAISAASVVVTIPVIVLVVL
ncbi:MAG TPA: carbohydrate ABC transporter permease, partial [Gaiellaceae bacterium]|nr:carbohydrate ABC transporter permease [Gaiellaceae bacterium]